MSKLIGDRVKSAEYARQIHRVTPEAGTTLADVLTPEYWVHVAAKFIVGDKVEVFPEGGAWYAEAVVVACSRIHVKLALLLHKEIHAVEKTSPKVELKKAPFEIAFKGPQRKWSVVRTKDSTYVREGFDDKDGATKWLSDNQKDLMA